MQKVIITFILTCSCMVSYSQNADLIKPFLKQKIKNHVRQNYDNKRITSIEFHMIYTFKFEDIKAKYETPSIFINEDYAVQHNIQMIKDLRKIADLKHITAFTEYIFGVKQKNETAWNPHWSLVLLDENNQIIKILEYYP